jgi:hypothetical protein
MAGIYRQHHPEHMVFYRVFFHYFERFLQEYENSKKLIGLPLVRKILNWHHTGFNVHSQVRAQTKSGAERVGKYMIRYYGLYSNAHRGKIRKEGADPSHPPIIEDDPTYVPSKGWAEMIRKVYEVDPLLCPSCGGG